MQGAGKGLITTSMIRLTGRRWSNAQVVVSLTRSAMGKKNDNFVAHNSDYYEGRVLPPAWIAIVIILSALIVICAATVVCLFSMSGM